MDKDKVSVQDLMTGTPINAGSNAGVNRRLELGLGLPLQQACGIHDNELTLLHVFKNADGETSGKASFKEPIGKIIQGDLMGLPLTQFKPVSGLVSSIPTEVRKEMN